MGSATMTAPDRILAQRAIDQQLFPGRHATATSRRVHRLASKRRRQGMKRLEEVMEQARVQVADLVRRERRGTDMTGITQMVLR